MRLNRLGDSDLQVSEICLGTMTWGEQNSEAEAHAQLDFAFSRGINFIDAAEMYPVPPRAETQGRTESYLGSWLARQPRDRLIVATKITPPGRGFGWIRGGALSLTRGHVAAAVDGSLQRMRTDYIDLYQIHWPERYVPSFGKAHYDPIEERPATPIREQLEALEMQVRAGKVRYVGLSNETPWGVMEFLRLAREHNLPRVVSIQNAYNLLNRAFEGPSAEVTRHENVPLLAYSPLAFGHLTGKYLGGAQPGGARLTRFPPFGQRYQKPNVAAASAAYAQLAEEAGMSATTLALAFVRSRFFVASTIIGATTLEQLAEDVNSASVDLSPETLAALDELHFRYTNPAV
jgi:aryl-alcohol dehydrogenase-like predicted oxidoreductase